MKKFFFTLILSTFYLLLFTDSTHAALVTINSEGQITTNVLGSQDSLALNLSKRSQIKVTDSAGKDSDENLLLLEKTGDKIYLNDFDVTNINDDIIEIEERGEVKRITIGVKEDKFTIEQNGAVATTSYPITIDPRRNEFAVKTSSGSVFLTVLPIEAAESAVRSRFLSQVNANSLELSEAETGVLTYAVSGEKVLDIFGFYDYEIPVTAQVSAATGEILAVDGPEWFRIFSFLFT